MQRHRDRETTTLRHCRDTETGRLQPPDTAKTQRQGDYDPTDTADTQSLGDYKPIAIVDTQRQGDYKTIGIADRQRQGDCNPQTLQTDRDRETATPRYCRDMEAWIEITEGLIAEKAFFSFLPIITMPN